MLVYTTIYYSEKKILLRTTLLHYSYFPHIADQMHDYVKTMDDELGELVSNRGLAFVPGTMLNRLIK